MCGSGCTAAEKDGVVLPGLGAGATGEGLGGVVGAVVTTTGGALEVVPGGGPLPLATLGVGCKGTKSGCAGLCWGTTGTCAEADAAATDADAAGASGTRACVLQAGPCGTADWETGCAPRETASAYVAGGAAAADERTRSMEAMLTSNVAAVRRRSLQRMVPAMPARTPLSVSSE